MISRWLRPCKGAVEIGTRPVLSARYFSLTMLALCLALFSPEESRAATRSVTLSWGASAATSVVGYKVYMGGATQTYSNSVSVGNTTNATFSGLIEGATYYFAAAAINALGLEGDLSNEVGYTVPVSASSPPTIALTSPTAGASYVSPATISLASTVIANGHAIAKVQFLDGTASVGECTVPPYSLTLSGVGAGTHAYGARLWYDGTLTLDSAPVTVTVASLPPPWQTCDVGGPCATGNAAVSGGVYTVVGAGTLSGTADTFRFTYQSLSGDGEMSARINSIQNTGAAALAGVMIRETLTPGSQYALIGLTPAGGYQFQKRVGTSSSSVVSALGSGTPPATWVRLVRKGKTFYAYTSVDGVKWTLNRRDTLTMASNIYIGLAVASGTSTTLNSSSFGSLAVIP